MLFTAQMASAQQNMFVVGNNGEITAISVSSVDYATFNASDKWFTFSNDGIESATKSMITADCTVMLATDSEVKSLSVTPEVGVCYSKNNAVPTIEDGCLLLGSELKSYTFTLNSLISGTDYYFRPYVKLANAVFYGDVDTAKTLGTKPADNSKTINGHKFIDLGLPSGLLWAETNIGAETAADDGDYYAWGKTATQSKYTSSNYNSFYPIEAKTTLDNTDDAAYVNWGSSCRMPTNDEFGELLDSDNCTWRWTGMVASNGSSIEGYQVTSVRNGNSIFLPASGYRYDLNVVNHGSHGNYWSSVCKYEGANHGYYLGFNSSSHNQNYWNRYFGCTIRPVAEP
jgi:hypothetical protein